MATQLDRLAAVSQLPNVALRVAPFSVGLHSGMQSGSFEILRFPLNGSGGGPRAADCVRGTVHGCALPGQAT